MPKEEEPMKQLLEKTFSWLGDLIALNLLWLLGCLPVLTTGASTAAMYAAAAKLADGKCTSVWRTYWAAFRGNFKKATAAFFLLLLPTAVLAADLWLLMRYSGQFPVWVKAVTLLAGVVFLLSAGYVYPLQARFENTVWKTLINSCVMALAHLPVSLAVAALNLLGPVLAMTAPGLFFRSIPVWLLFGAALTALLNTLLLRGVFCKYIPQNRKK